MTFLSPGDMRDLSHLRYLSNLRNLSNLPAVDLHRGPLHEEEEKYESPLIV